MELGCFMAGVVLSTNGEHLVHQVNIHKNISIIIHISFKIKFGMLETKAILYHITFHLRKFDE